MRVLVFHKVNDSENFERQIIYLKRHYDIIDKNFSDHTGQKHEAQLRNPLLITFDDGDYSVYENAYPILVKHEIPAIVFVVTSLINTNKPFWWDELEYYLGSSLGNKKTWEVKKWPNKVREEYLKELRKKSDKPPVTDRQLTTTELQEMQKNGICIANHSHTHPMFDKCSPLEIEQEILNSKSILNSLGFEGEFFAYPNGNFSKIAESILISQGIKRAFLFDHEINKELDNLRISRLIVNDTTPIWKLKFILSGWHKKFLPLTKRIGKLLK